MCTYYNNIIKLYLPTNFKVVFSLKKQEQCIFVHESLRSRGLTGLYNISSLIFNNNIHRSPREGQDPIGRDYHYIQFKDSVYNSRDYI